MTRRIATTATIAVLAAALLAAAAPAQACQCSPQIAQAVTTINGNTNAVVNAMQLAITEAIAKSTTQLSAVSRQQTMAQQRMADSREELEKLRAGNAQRARIRDDQKMTPEQATQYCATLNAGAQAGGGAGAVAALAADMQRRGEERNNFRDIRTSARSSLEYAYKNFCDAESEKAGVCKAAPLPQQNADISARNLMHGSTFTNAGDILTISDMPYTPAAQEAAVRFCETVGKPVIETMISPPPIGADAATQAAYLRQRNQSQRINLVQNFCSAVVAVRAPMIKASPDQQKMLQELYSKLPPAERPTTTALSYNQLVASEVDQRFGANAVKWGERMARNKSAPDQLYEQNLQLALISRILLDMSRTIERGFAMQMPSAATDSNIVIQPAVR
jgi:hypothetical protein